MTISQICKLVTISSAMLCLSIQQVSYAIEFSLSKDLQLEVSAEDITTSDNFSKIKLTNQVVISTNKFSLQASQAALSLENTRKDVIFTANQATLYFNNEDPEIADLDLDSVSAATIVYSSVAQTLELLEKVELLSKGITINADKVTIDLDTSSIQISGNTDLPAKIILTK